ncbi:glycosyltransferase family 4 protein [Bradyrhizobium cenepequi]|uniref:glycosyltransferase family 4 protein n=1 Tax=Bradyrhizobium cenepequi TaxID=2821403 RepID=UPI001CE29DEF|nr:glycosyltransferase family 4 protein [Bradyrhizobium cenepequi]MCA6107159.1 glycosyltransferase family 4 protein [Bradyrhizobium cenepequi]
MKVLLYPHSMEVGGSQLNAIQLAGSIRDRGHEVIVLSEAGPLVERVRKMALEHIELPQHWGRPSPKVIRMIGHLVRQRRIDVVHGHEWPPIIEAFLSSGISRRTAVVGTVMSMSVASFLPRNVPLTVGTEFIRQAAIAAGHRRVELLEPPVDTKADNPSIDGQSFRAQHGVQPHEVLIAIVCRLVPDLKLEGLLSACDAVRELAVAGHRVRLVIVGDGRARGDVARRATEVNASAGYQAVLMIGEMADPRPAYAAADIILGQGGSALRGMAFGKPLVVIGEEGFSELVTPESASIFLRQGWYGLGSGSLGAGPSALRMALGRLVRSPELRCELGIFGRRLTERRFSLDHAAEVIENLYTSAIDNPAPFERVLSDVAHVIAGVFGNKIERRYQRWIGKAPTDDSNARNLIAAILANGKRGEMLPSPSERAGTN